MAVRTVASFQFDTLTDLRSQAGDVGVQVLLNGLNSTNDGNGGIYMWDSTSTATDDGFVTIAVTGVTTGRWKRLPNANTIKGSVTLNGTGIASTFNVSHGLPFTPIQVYVQPRSVNAAVPSWISSINSSTFTINFTSIPILGTNNLVIDWLAIKQ